MKNLKLLILLVSLPFCFACNDDDDSNTTPINSSLDGSWNLVHVSGGFGGEDNEFEEGLITWTFNESEGTITVVNNNPADLYDALGTGTYTYDLMPVESMSCNTSLNVTLDDMILNFGCMTIVNNDMTISNLESDGYLHTFKR